MKRLQFLRTFYAVLLNLYPRTYRDEYRGELQSVFDLALDDAIKAGIIDVLDVLSRELMGLPMAIFHEHLRERRKAQMTGKFASHFDFAPGSRNEALAALAPFLLGGALPTLFSFIGSSIDIPMWIQIVFTLFMWFLVGSLLVLGFKKRAPRWFMPYLGLPLPIISLIVFNTLVSPEWHGFPFLRESSWFIKQVFNQGVLWIWLLLSILLIFMLTRFIPVLRSFNRRLHADWTLLPFILYGAMPFVIVISFEEFKNEEPYLLLSFLALAIGGWFYLRNSSSWNKFWSLIIGLTLAMSVAVIGQTLLYESSFPFTSFPRWTTTLSTVIMWIWMVLYMFGSAALNLLRHSNEPFSSSG